MGMSSTGVEPDAPLDASAALFSIHYHLLKLGREPGLSHWVEEVERLECWGRGEIIGRIASVDQAVDLIARRDSGRFLPHAIAVLERGKQLIGLGRGSAGRDAFSRGFERLCNEARRHRREAHGNAGGADRTRAHDDGHSKPSRPAERDFEILHLSYDRRGVSRFEARVARAARPEDDFRKIAQSADPRNWATAQSEFFAHSYKTNDPTPSNPFENPREDGQTPEGGWRGHLFEEAKFAVLLAPGVYASNLRNTLNIDYAVNSEEKKAELHYSLYESLSSRAFRREERHGGLDVDSGTALVELNGEQLVVTARKDLRFSPAMSFAAEFNLVTLPFLTLWLSFWICGSLQELTTS